MLLSSHGSAQGGEKVEKPLLSDMNFSSVTQKATDVEDKLDKVTEKYLQKLQKQETKLKRKIAKVDSFKAQALFAGLDEKYAALRNAPQSVCVYANVYSGHLDSLTTLLSFLKSTGRTNEVLSKSLLQLSSLQAKMKQTEAIKQFIQQRKRLLQERLQQLGMLKELKGFSKEAYYYSAQLKEYRSLWEDPSKLEMKVLEWAMKTEGFKDFFQRNSQLAALFPLPDPNDASIALQGLQTRASVQQAIQNRFGSGPPVQQLITQNIQAAQEQLNELKERLAKYGSGSFGNSIGNVDLPEGFKPNQQKCRTFLERLEYGANIQNQKARSYFPGTSDIGLSLGYKLSDNSSIGVGASYKLGLGKGWDHIRLTHEGVGLRSYIDYKLKGSIYINGGYEQNFRTAFQNLQQLKNYSAWQTSGLIGLSKKYKVSKKLKGDMKLLWDFLSYQQIPRTQAVLFRIGYNLK